jgi:16S rRNA (cytosine1402-N4)-methyltransferase
VTDLFPVPLLAEAAVDLLMTTPAGVYVDCTLGGGGHSRIISERLTPQGHLIGCDRDAEAIEYARRLLPSSVEFFQISFSHLFDRLSTVVPDGVHGVLFDLGVSSHQLDEVRRGFSYRSSAPLDLRMDPSTGESAAILLARLNRRDLAHLIWEYGEDSQAARIAKAIDQERHRAPIETTDHLAQVISDAVPATRMKSLPRVFQALRIAVNHELDELRAGLAASWKLLKPNGKLIVISYHSLEDRIVKNFMQELAQPIRDPRIPVPPDDQPLGKLLIRKPVSPDSNEIVQNPRSRSAKLRAIEKLK